MKSLKLAFLLAIASAGSTAFSQITVSGDFAAGTGQLAIQQDLTFTMLNNASGTSGYILVFEGMNGGQDASQTEMLTVQGTWQRSINGGPDTTMNSSSGYWRFSDRLGGSGSGDIGANDSYFYFTNSTENFAYATGTTLTMRAMTYTFSNTSANFDADAMGSFSGNVYLVNIGAGLTRMTDKIAISAVPEPSTYALCGGIAALGLALWSRRRRTAA